jgi:hypothetical protein
MSEKKLESNSIYNQFDADGDGIVTDAEMAQADRLMEMNQKRLEIENQDKREDAQRAMSWFALFGMLLYPASVVVADLLMLDKAPGILGRYGSYILCICCSYSSSILWYTGL